MEPVPLLLGSEANTTEIRLEELAHQSAGDEVALEEDDEVAARQEDAGAEDEQGGPESDGFVEGVETGGGKDETPDVGDIGEAEDGEGDGCFLGAACEQNGQGFGGGIGVCATVARGVHA